MTDTLRDELQAALGAAYTLDRELGGGGMSRVFVARDVALGRDVVVKVLAPDLSEGLSAERFAREIRLAAALQDPHIVPLLSAGATANGLPYYTMPFVRGASLRERVTARSMPLAEATRILRDIALALQYAHEQGVVHRDIKPENVLLAGSSAVVTDFGIAKALSVSRTNARTALTQRGTALGTPAYMAPEQAVGDEADARTDVYAWGVIAYELLVGAHPFASRTTAQQLIAAHIAETPAPLAPADIPPALAGLVMRTLEKEPGKRPQSAQELVDTIDALGVSGSYASSQTADTTRQHAGAPSRFSRSARAVLAAVCALLAGGAFWQMSRNSNSANASARTTPDERTMIAVLPFENIGADDQAIFTDGLTDAVTSKLSGLSGLGVIDRRSALQYKLSTKPAKQIGRELGVRYLVQGVVRWVRDAAGAWRAQVTPSLVNTASGVTEWTGTAAVITPDDPFTAQGTIASDVAKELQIELAPSDRAGLARRFTDNPQAFAAYQRGRAILDLAMNSSASSSPAAWARAAAEFERAVALDSSLHSAWGFLAYSRYIGATYSANDGRAVSRARAVIRLAEQKAPDDPQLLLTVAVSRIYSDEDTAGVAELLSRALRNAPNDADVLARVSTFPMVLGKERSFDLARQAAILDPRSSYILILAAVAALETHNPTGVNHYTDALLALDSANPTAWTMKVRALALQGDTSGIERITPISKRWSPQPDHSLDGLLAMYNRVASERFLAYSGEELRLNTLADTVWWYFDAKIAASLKLADTKRAAVLADSVVQLLADRRVEGPDEAGILQVLAFAQSILKQNERAAGTLARAIAVAPSQDGVSMSLVFLDPVTAAATLVRIGKPDEAIKWMVSALDGPHTARSLAVDPRLFVFHGAPEFEAFQRKYKQ